MIRDYSSLAGMARKPMPVWARVIAAGTGLLLLAAGVGALVAVRPLGLTIAMSAVAAAMVGLDLVGAASSGKWPVTLRWMPLL